MANSWQLHVQPSFSDFCGFCVTSLNQFIHFQKNQYHED